MAKSLACQVHGYHWPRPRSLDDHHIYPLGMGGLDVRSNVVRVCPTGHRNIHAAIRALVAGGALSGTRREIMLARSGFEQWRAAGEPTVQAGFFQ